MSSFSSVDRIIQAPDPEPEPSYAIELAIKCETRSRVPHFKSAVDNLIKSYFAT